VTRNYVSRPLAWKTQSWQVKNVFELKNARRVVVRGNVFENNWTNAQTGVAILITPRNQDGACTWCTVADVDFQFNVVRHTAGAFNLTGVDDHFPTPRSGTSRSRTTSWLTSTIEMDQRRRVQDRNGPLSDC
jgi:hypothetical protein